MSLPPLGIPLLIANPSAGRADGGILDRLVAALEECGVTPDVVRTDGRGHASHIARRAVEDGRRLLVAVGGDGTVHEIVNGIIDPETGTPRHPGATPVVGIVGAGSGSDLTRTFGLDRRPELLAAHLCTDATTTIDLMRLRFRDAAGRPAVRLGVNVVEAGYGAAVVRRANAMPRRLGPLRYAAGIVAAVPAFRRVPTTITHDHGTTDEPVCNVVIANGQFFGGGLRVAPLAMPADGELDLQSWGGRPIDVIRAQPQLRRGEHLKRPDVRSWRSTTVTVEASRPLDVEADGEVLGTTPLQVEVVPGALTLKL
ncbi:MAG: diacylglycerol kinase family lipid kinase [Nitriliruptoraceae bacterium]|nr:diacylglycerol kinase family lipid kinase [Nitriliruptoraceae bacterium]